MYISTIIKSNKLKKRKRKENEKSKSLINKLSII